MKETDTFPELREQIPRDYACGLIRIHDREASLLQKAPNRVGCFSLAGEHAEQHNGIVSPVDGRRSRVDQVLIGSAEKVPASPV